MDDIKLFSKNEKELETLIQSGRMCSQEIRMEFGIEKYAMLIMRSGNRHITGRIERPNQEKNQTALRKGNLQILGNIRSRHHQTSGDERKKLQKSISGEREISWKG